ncbi:MAG: DOMON domain-containing protein [Sporomusaceae bacterium]|nr:DOMON domain-containing protein [Sporomusaceae bacterium]
MPRAIPGALLATLIMVFALAGCGGQKTPVQPPAPSSPAPVTISQEWKADGVVGDGEYAQMQKIGELEVFSRIEGDSVMLALKAQTKGWLALGIDPEEKMKGADMIFGYVKDGQAVISDMYSTGVVGPHPPDDKQGGTADITAAGGSHKDGVLVLEVKRKLNTGDSRDKPLKIGDNKVIWAIGDAADAGVKHSRRGYGTLVLKN